MAALDDEWLQQQPRWLRREIARDDRAMRVSLAKPPKTHRARITKARLERSLKEAAEPAPVVDLAGLACPFCGQPQTAHDLKSGRCPIGVIDGMGVMVAG